MIHKNKLSLSSLIKEGVLFLLLMGVAIASPLIVHAAGGKGTVLLPIFYALVLSANILSFLALLSLAIVGPIVNSILFGMPQAPIMYLLILEGITFVAVFSTLKSRISVYLNIIIALIVGRIVAFFLYWIILHQMNSAVQFIFDSLPGFVILYLLGVISAQVQNDLL